ncbi:bacteriocin [Spirosoma sp. KCTC 42546]|uniref:bacteriocin n=1 Tax=Spirosoma sp. KCTC 42546 TaxID=2520506 RepID=UPI0011587DF1|nr:bacteriocin [Spirosoma sp. KCTC 42546]QDK82397.1 bacteriocin [Spirosoma sp. KCTC 42546]
MVNSYFDHTDVVELKSNELVELEGGVIPLVLIGVGWGVMLVCSAVALGLKEKYNL